MSHGEEGRTGGPARLTRVLAAVFLVNGLLVNLALLYSPWQPQKMTTLRYAQAYFEQTAHDDSWRPMRAAFLYLDRASAEPDRVTKQLYELVFFEQGVKFQYPPTSLLVLEPLRRSPYGDLTSDRVLNRISWLCVLALALVVARIFALACERWPGAAGQAGSRERRLQMALVVGCALLFYPLLRSYYGGQIQTWIDLLFGLLVWAWLAGRRGVAGALAGLICVIKPALGLLLVWAALRRHWRFLIGWSVVVASAGVCSLLLYGLGAHLDYLSVLSFISQHGESFHANQSVNGTLHRMLGNGPNLRWEGSRFAPYHPWVHAGTLLSSLALVGAALFWRSRDAERAEALDLLLVVTSFTLAAPVVWEHHYGVVLPVFAVLLPAAMASRPRVGVAVWLGLALAYALISNNFRVLNRLAASPLNFLQSYVLVGGLALLAVLYRLRGVQSADAAVRPEHSGRQGPALRESAAAQSSSRT